MRGRSRGKGPNPLTRTYESNGPDVKVRGTAQHVADKYAQLARDAQASGDPVAAENYFQHAEHYYRIIAAAQEALRQQFGGFQRSDEDGDEGEDDLGMHGGNAMNGFGYGHGGDDFDPGQQPQPYDTRAERQDYRGDRQDYRQDYRGQGGQDQRGQDHQRGERQDFRGERGFNGRPDRGPRPDRRERFQRGDQRPDQRDQRPGDGRFEQQRREQYRPESGGEADQPRAEQQRFEQPRSPEPPRMEAPRDETQPRAERPRRERRRNEAPDEQPGLPAFLTKPAPRIAPAEPEAQETAPPAPVEEAAEAPKPRRRRAPARRAATGEEGAAPTPEHDAAE